MKYYSERIFTAFSIINMLACVIAVGSLCIALSWSGISLLFGGEGYVFNLFAYIIPSLYFLLSIFIILLQQKGHKRFGYLMAVLVCVSLFYFLYFQTEWNFWTNINYFLSSTPWFILIFEFILLVGSLIPFYVLGRLIKEDFFDKKR
jgi:uncharacterized membrane protein